MTSAGSFLLAAAASLVASTLFMRLPRPVAANHRGTRIPVVLGWAVLVGVLAALASRLGHSGGDVVRMRDRLAVATAAGAGVVFLAGLYDDLHRERSHGLVAQLVALRRGRLTPGVVRLVAAVGAAGLLMALRGRWSPGLMALAVPTVAGAANGVNLLDVRPGRAVKFALPWVALLGWLAPSLGYPFIAAATVGAALAVLPPDLRERAMLGDAGSTLLGFLLGVGLVSALSNLWLAVALALIVVEHVLAETVTLSRLIDAVPPLRWYDRAGRVRPVQTTPP